MLIVALVYALHLPLNPNGTKRFVIWTGTIAVTLFLFLGIAGGLQWWWPI